MDWGQQKGQICETILTEYLLRKKFYVLRPLSAFGPVDLFAYNDKGQTYLFDAKKELLRKNPGRNFLSRINRPRSAVQKKLNVHIAYVNIDDKTIFFSPRIEEFDEGLQKRIRRLPRQAKAKEKESSEK